MPTITFSLKDLRNLVQENISIDELEHLLSFAKGELENYDKETDEVSVFLGDTNLPYLWSLEGIARHLKAILGKQKGIPKFTARKSNYQVIVDSSVKQIRPYLAAFVAKGKEIDEYLLKQMINLQEKFCENYGRHRQKVSIGIYSYKKITFPVHYKATEPESVKFTPLEFQKEMTQQEILEEHPKGIEYAWILKDFKKYPLLVDDKNNVLSFPPIINSNLSGKIEPGDSDLFIEVTGTDNESTILAANIFAQALFDRGFDIYSTEINYPDKKITCPFDFNDSIKINLNMVTEIMGIDLTEQQIKNLLEKSQYNYDKGTVQIPFYRKDIMHPCDVIEDIAIAYGFNNIKPKPLESYTPGKTFEIIRFIDLARETALGLGYQEIMSPILSNKETLYKKMDSRGKIEKIKEELMREDNLKSNLIEIKEFMSERYSVARTWILPVLMDVLSKNKHIDYPQKIFEEGIVTIRKGNEIKDIHRIALLSAHANANYTEARQALDYLMGIFGIKYEVKETEHSSFIPGRVGRVYVKNKAVAYLGEISPQVLANWDITKPAAGFELNLTELFQIL
ncbi:phenylalanine--tRNA ligase subunit beta [Candidatus Woesearchaeota archaeon]|nr:phenylalanine--tRNA ligase subunit beta [Candidatus Woesearchaeota archaeon]